MPQKFHLFVISFWFMPVLVLPLWAADRSTYDGLIEQSDRLRMKAPAQAMELLNQAAKNAPNMVPIHLKKCTLYCDQGKGDQAIREANLALRADPQCFQAWEMIAYQHLSRGEMAKGIADLGRALAINPDDEQAYLSRSRAYTKLGRPDLSSKDLQTVQTRKKASELFVESARLNDSGDRAQSMKLLTMAIDAAPERSRYYSQRAQMEEQSGNRQAALTDRARALKLRPNDFEFEKVPTYRFENLSRAQIRLNFDVEDELACARLHLSQKNYRAALADYAALIQLDARVVPLGRALRAELFLSRGQSSAAVEEGTALIKSNPKLVQAYTLRALAREKAGDLKNAVADLKQAHLLAPKDDTILQWQSSLYSRMNRQGTQTAARQKWAGASIAPVERTRPDPIAQLKGSFKTKMLTP